MGVDRRDTDAAVARRLVLGGRVQGVGFRPFVYRKAVAFGLSGWVRNEIGRVVIHVEGEPVALDGFARALFGEAPPSARPELESAADAEFTAAASFAILASAGDGPASVHLPPDLFCCPDCLAEIDDPSARRHRYAFTNCTQCGPRYTIIAALPYDRANTSMAGFALCPSCRAEYADPRDRRFHAEPLACPDCGPQLSFVASAGVRREGEDAMRAALACLRQGGIVAVKGVGGYHLMCDAADDAAVERLRSRKHRPDKPLAVMFPQRGKDGLDAVRAHVRMSATEAAACRDPARPIVLCARRPETRLSRFLAPGLAELGVFLPYSPLHHLLLSQFGAPLVATSGNISGEPVITDDGDAERRLAPVADAFLHHDRPILRPADDSVVRVIAAEPRPLRIGRGQAPLEIALAQPLSQPTLAVGGHQKAAIALGWERRAVISPHIGDLDSPRSLAVFEQVIADLERLYRVRARRIVCDLHPGYGSARWAARRNRVAHRVQHHAAHASALAGEHPQIARWLVFAWDGVGLGSDGELWGGEALLGRPGAWRRAAGFRRFHLLGGDRAGREPWRAAAALVWETQGAWRPDEPAARTAHHAWQRRLGTLATSSAGRLFDAAAALVLGLDRTSYEGQGPMMLESLADSAAQASPEAVALPLAEDGEAILRADWAPLLPMLRDESRSAGQRAALFHECMARTIRDQAVALRRGQAFDAVGLTGGVFQNRRLAERALALLGEAGIAAYLPCLVPANDGGLAFGQLIEILAREDGPGAPSGERTP